jgi:hypothetical protein
LLVGHIVTIFIGNEIEVRRRHHPSAAEAHFDSRDIVQFVMEHGSFIKCAITIDILKNENSVLPLSDVVGIAVGLGHPQSSPVVDAKTDRLTHIRLARKQLYLKSFRHNHSLSRFRRR